MQATLIFRGGCKVENMASDSDNKEPSLEAADIATTVLARDYKGLSNYASNAVIEIYEIKD